MKPAQSSRYRYPNDVNDVVLVSLLFTLNRFTPSFSVANFEQANACWDDNNNDDNSQDDDVDRTDFTINLIFINWGLRAEALGPGTEETNDPICTVSLFHFQIVKAQTNYL